jgi:hypothetical protein
MEAESRSSDDLADATRDQLPTDQPPADVPDAPRRHPVVSLFTRRAFLSRHGRRPHEDPSGPGHGDERAAQ